jgi:hypothetical protein
MSGVKTDPLSSTPRVIPLDSRALESRAIIPSAAKASSDGATVVQVGPELPSPEAASKVVDVIAERLAAEPSKALNAVSNLDADRINRLLLDE